LEPADPKSISLFSATSLKSLSTLHIDRKRLCGKVAELLIIEPSRYLAQRDYDDVHLAALELKDKMPIWSNDRDFCTIVSIQTNPMQNGHNISTQRAEAN
jgi:hypothetical protein